MVLPRAYIFKAFSLSHRFGFTRALSDNVGFTLPELVLVIGILSALFTAAFPMSLSFIYSYLLVTDRDTLIVALETARSRSMARVGTEAHSVHISSEAFTVFPGTTFVAGGPFNDVYRAHGAVIKSGTADTISFSSLSGAAQDSDIELSANGHRVSVHVNTEGAIE